MTSARALLETALGHHQAGRLAEAEALYRQVLADEPENADCLHLMGMLADQQGRSDTAVALIERAVALEPAHAAARSNLGLVLQRMGRLDDAIIHYREAARLRPDLAQLHGNLGLALREKGDFASAAEAFRGATAAMPGWADAHLNLGAALIGEGKPVDAAASFAEAVRLRPDWAAAHNDLGLALMSLDRPADAVAALERALALDPDMAEAHNNLGRALQVQGRLGEAVARFERALALQPDMAEAHNHLGLALKEQGRLAEAVVSFERAAALKPTMAEIQVNLGTALQDLGRGAEAVASFERALRLRPGMAEAHLGYGLALQDQGAADEARAHYEAAVAANPGFAEARLALCMAQLPAIYAYPTEIALRRTAYADALRLLRDDVGIAVRPADLAKAIGTSQPFFLAYQGENDRDLQALYGELACRVSAELYPPAAPAPPPGPQERIRVGFVSGFFRRHSNWKMPIKGWLEQLDRSRFRVFGFHTGADCDADTEEAVALCERFVQGPLSVAGWRTAILADAPHVLIYPEIGMDPMAARLAAMRLARVQCNSWGHPDTSGFPTLDYFLSSDLMEPPNGQDHYTERLIRLPNLSVYCEAVDATPTALGRPEFGIRDSATAFWCGQSLFKYLPQHDEALVRIAQAVPDSQFVFIAFSRLPHATAVFRHRIAKAFARAGLDAERHCLFLPRLDARRFVAASGLCDVFLDSIGWSGCNSTLEGLPHDLPIVTIVGPLMRGRHSAAILQMMGVTETVAADIDGYVTIAVRLALDPAFRAQIKGRVAAGKHLVYRDRECIRALEAFLEEAARGA